MERKLKVGLVGASASGGWSGVAHIPALKTLKNVELAAICTTRPASAKAASEKFGIERAYSNINDLVSQHDIDIVSVVVKIPNHFDVVKTALEAGRHVYCEWPLGASLQETEELARLADKKGLITAIGLQGHQAPELLYIKQLYEEGWFGKVVNISMLMQTKASSERETVEAWEDEKQRKATLFSIVGGHTLYYLSHIFGGITEVSGQLTTQLKELTIKDSGEKVYNDIPDQINIQGLLIHEIPFTTQLSAVPHKSSGWSLEVYGTEGALKATSAILPQITPINLQVSKGGSEYEPKQVPQELVRFNYLPDGPAGNVGRNYGAMVEAILKKENFRPNFDDALAVERLLEVIQRSSDEKRTIKTVKSL